MAIPVSLKDPGGFHIVEGELEHDGVVARVFALVVSLPGDCCVVGRLCADLVVVRLLELNMPVGVLRLDLLARD